MGQYFRGYLFQAAGIYWYSCQILSPLKLEDSFLYIKTTEHPKKLWKFMAANKLKPRRPQ